MLIPKKDRRLIYEYLFTNGVLVAAKNVNLPKHSDELPVKNLYVTKLAQSLTSKGFIKETFAWQHHYYYLTDAGINYLREALGAPAEVVPSTLKEKARPARPTSLPERRGPPRGGFRGGDREGYRRNNKEGAAPGGFAPRFAGNAEGGERPARSAEGGDRPRRFGGRGGAPRGDRAPAQPSA
ncbi:40S small subunit ribosomal protein eS10 (rpS10) [Andalucia godoyi]|uniref:40S small subunit ribosomal protein eS10 (RpS10) n=1 Tax=Andalucia godoyi TaxID=505711 RepID=A0A8K0AHM5_ANDGO|nr:40S small subunit ribosomal protein eS10 (rpS10) [Andalucia godoyi]|eukprot:ANDGO_05696.mRNA.1 40S small subunit ribosomal protein eS10 (rpS10)